MNNKPWLLIDTACLAYRSLYSLGDLSFDGVATGAIYGMFQTVLKLQDLFATDRIAWCFDRGYGVRTAVFPDYKISRHKHRWEQDEEQKEARRIMRQQLFRLRTEYLPGIGFKNVFWQDDYEADDVIASVCLNLPDGEEAIIVSTDNDLYQLLTERVSMWNPASGKPVTADSFRREYGIGSELWPAVKAIGGCSSDEVPGIVGVGVKKSIQFLRGEMKPGKTKQAIIDGEEIIRRNLMLVELPFPGTQQFKLQEDGLTDERWKKVMGDLGFKSMRERAVGVKR